MTSMTDTPHITADAVALQERDEFREAGWLKVLAPAKVNLHLAIGERRPDGYHAVATVMHALTLHDALYLRPSPHAPTCRMVAGDPSIELPDLAAADNIAVRAVAQLADELGLDPAARALDIRIEKNIPAQAGLGGGSSDAAAALVGAAHLWNVPADDPRIEQVARRIGADVAFFLRGGCAYLEGAGDEFVHALVPSRQALALVKPAGGVSTAEAYRRFDEHPAYASADLAARVSAADQAADVALYNNLAPASEALMPELAEVRAWLDAQPQTQGVLLCGSGATTFALCDDFAAATVVATEARKRGWWSRATSLAPLRAAAVGVEAQAGRIPGASERQNAAGSPSSHASQRGDSA